MEELIFGSAEPRRKELQTKGPRSARAELFILKRMSYKSFPGSCPNCKSLVIAEKCELPSASPHCREPRCPCLLHEHGSSVMHNANCFFFSFAVLRNIFILSCMLIACSLLFPVLWHLWIFAGSANSNFYYAITLTFNIGQVSRVKETSE